MVFVINVERMIKMIDVLMDALMDTIKLIPYLLITFIILEVIEHKMSKKNTEILKKDKKYGPLLGGFLGAIPQCGFSTMASNLFSGRVITMGTLIAVFLSTSDEMLPIMLGSDCNKLEMLAIIFTKVIIGIIVGFIVDIVYKKEENDHIHELCEEGHCSCDHHGVFLSSLIHTLKITLFILIANILIGLIIFYVGEDNLSNILKNNSIFAYLISSLIGLIPNCASSVIITDVYLSGLISLGTLFAGLLTGSGLGLLILFKTNKDLKENLQILSTIYLTGVLVGFLIDIII